MTKRKLYFIVLAVTLLLGFLTSFLTKLGLSGAFVDASDIVIFIAAIVVGPIGGAVCALGAALGDIACGFYLYSIITLIVGCAQGVLCGYVYKYALRNASILKGKILAVLVGVGAAILLNFACDFVYYGEFNEMIVSFVAKTVARVICAVIAVLVMPRIPHLFDEERYVKDTQNEE